MKLEKIVCPHCQQRFTYYEVTNIVEHTRQLQPIECPYCRFIASKKIYNGYFVSQKLEDSDKKIKLKG
ncbi:DNA-directed RNA polymerase subunit RPC12/RpoP [Enterococcus sp. PF1-24]|uniref:hypothetical protein n=1 Tax=unclassified Enterococcus TaxID=2608891 RepID=UPI00247483F2|nr:MULTISPECIES: hypothetical protein [unclassified Enterococcus]MDH6365306.1 DNA-directed RNA polymerase subunit RPC12/RpoP [Enterococcus sp. PFB1-1]MDH6402438.1 DNA-directed RNA polymerase subunit RPC12/RpoP [Enterococcus sp. PF1-24]